MVPLKPTQVSSDNTTERFVTRHELEPLEESPGRFVVTTSTASGDRYEIGLIFSAIIKDIEDIRLRLDRLSAK